MSTEVKKEEKIVYPDQLNIIIRTSVPGYQNIEYKPSMTIKGSDEKTVRFNPLIKLNKSIIEKIPEEYRIKEFFNKGLFQSLLNYNGGTPAKNLTQATRYGYVDNNIRVTLNTIFPVGSVIYIGKNPYAIGDIQWTTGDWKIEIKQKKEEIDPSKITDPQLYTQLVREEIISGEEQLNQLPQEILTGVNYTGPPIARGPQPVPPPTVPPPTVPPPTVPPPTVPPPTVPPPTVPPPTVPPPTAGPIVVRPPPPATTPPTAGPIVVPPPRGPPPPAAGPIVVRPPPPATTPPAAIPPPVLFLPEVPRVEEISPEEENLFNTFKDDLEPNIVASTFFRKYFQSNSYKNIIKQIVNKFPPAIKTEIRKFYFATTNYEPKMKTVGLGNVSYDKLCEQVTILKSPSDGDCFFKAVADGINIYNYENQDAKIIWANYGKNELFTISILREIVYGYISQLQDLRDIFIISEEQVDPLNTKFQDSIEGLKKALNVPQLTNEQYLSELTNVYNSNSNFFIYKPKVVPIDIDKYNNPFRVIKPSELENYIKSKDYWANDVAIAAICEKLKICVIPIEKYNYNTAIRSKTSATVRLKALLTDIIKVKFNCSNKVMFLLYKNNHYELIRFKYFTKPSVKPIGEGLRNKIEYKGKWYTIFRSDDLSPPIHILILIYGTIYSLLDGITQQTFRIYKPIMKQINKAVLAILSSSDKYIFIKLFDNIFPSKVSIDIRANRKISQASQLALKNIDEDEDEGDEGGDYEEDMNPVDLMTAMSNIKNQGTSNENQLIGGEYRYNYPPYPYPPPYYRQYGYPRPGYITKKPEDRDSSKISYAITIDMELHPGTSLTPEQISQSKCNTKYNAIRKAFAEFTGRQYVIQPVYNKTVKNKDKSYVPVETKNNPRFNNTRRKAPPAASLGGKTRKHK